MGALLRRTLVRLVIIAAMNKFKLNCCVHLIVQSKVHENKKLI